MMQHSENLQSFSNFKISTNQCKNVKGGSGTITMLDTDLETIVKQPPK
ncbi:MAG: hypothetical protein AAF990_04615 [Bacteroidota bacterium]